VVGASPILRIVDGDTIRVMYEGREEPVRLLRINTPERDQPGYKESTEALRRLIGGRQVVLEFERPGELERDKYGRILAYVVADGVNVNIEMMRTGWSKLYTKYGEGKYAAEFRKAEEEARREGRGLWRVGK